MDQENEGGGISLIDSKPLPALKITHEHYRINDNPTHPNYCPEGTD
jgi:hypothetical protein